VASQLRPHEEADLNSLTPALRQRRIDDDDKKSINDTMSSHCSARMT